MPPEFRAVKFKRLKISKSRAKFREILTPQNFKKPREI